MSNNKILILLFYSCIYLVSCRFFSCPETSDPPEALDNSNFSIQPILYSGVSLTPVVTSGKVLINTHQNNVDSTKEYYKDSDYCPDDFIIPKKEDLEAVINNLGDQAYQTFTDKNGLDMAENIYYVTNTKGNEDYNKIFMILKNNAIQFEDFDPMSFIISPSAPKFYTICMLGIPDGKIVFPDDKKDFDYNAILKLQTNFNGYYTDTLWKINDQIIKNETVTITLNEPGVNNVEFWGKYVTGKIEYLCEIFYVENEKIPSNQEYADDKIKKITTDFKMHYNTSITFTTSNCPVAPRDDGGYYVAVSNTDKYLHILSFDKDDKLLKDFDTGEKARPHDITSTFIGFAVYVMDADNGDHSYITSYDKNFKMINRVQIMNNTRTEESIKIDSTPEKQLIRYNSNGKPQFGIRFIYQADNAKLVYSRGRIFLIFAHYNIFDDDYIGHNADTVATFSDDLEDIDFGLIFGASHSLIQSATFDDNYFWTASLSDAYPQGITVEYTSKKDFQNNYDAVAKKNNVRVYGRNDSLAGTIKGYSIGWADGKLGGLLYFEELELYCMVYAKTPNYSEDDKNGKNIIYMTTWKFVDGKIEQTIVKEIKIFETNNIMQVRAGKLGNDKVFITYIETDKAGHNYYGNVPKGTIPNIFVIKLPDLEFIKNDEKLDDLLMNTNEDLRTFRNGVLIWATSDSNNNLVINKIGGEAGEGKEEKDTSAGEGKEEKDTSASDNTNNVIPSVTWKDIYGLNMNGVKTINNTDIYGPTLNIRGITSSQIKTQHTFIIYLIFQLNQGLRNLEGEKEIRIPAICQVKEAVEENSDGINMVDYECVCNKANDIDLTNYKLGNIEEGNNENSLKKSNLNTLVKEIKEKYDGELDKLESVNSPSFTTSDLNKIVIFKMNEKISEIKAEDFIFNFNIQGKLNKDLSSEESTIARDFELTEVDNKAKCTFTIGANQVAHLGCNLNVENHKDIKEFSFKTSEIKTENNEIYLSKFNDITLINSEEEDNDNKTTIIVVSVVCAVVVAAGIGVGIYFLVRKMKSGGDNNNIVNAPDVKENPQTNNAMAVSVSENKVIAYKK